MSPTVSIIVPVYNTASYLPKCLDSALGQSMRDIEIICIDDGSTDNSKELLARYAAKDNRLRYFIQENKGLGAARNKGIAEAKGSWVGFLDSDDFLHPDMCSKAAAFGHEHALDIVVFNFNLVHQSSVEKATCCKWNNVLTGSPNACNKLFRRKVWQTERFPTGIIYEDYAIIPYLVFTHNSAYLNLPLYNYVIRTGSIMKEDTQLQIKMDIIPATQYLIEKCQSSAIARTYLQELEYVVMVNLLYYGSDRIRQLAVNQNKLSYYTKIRKQFNTLFPFWWCNKYFWKEGAYFKLKIIGWELALVPLLASVKRKLVTLAKKRSEYGVTKFL